MLELVNQGAAMCHTPILNGLAPVEVYVSHNHLMVNHSHMVNFSLNMIMYEYFIFMAMLLEVRARTSFYD